MDYVKSDAPRKEPHDAGGVNGGYNLSLMRCELIHGATVRSNFPLKFYAMEKITWRILQSVERIRRRMEAILAGNYRPLASNPLVEGWNRLAIAQSRSRKMVINHTFLRAFSFSSALNQAIRNEAIRKWLEKAKKKSGAK
jgi:hypothetical protein